MATELSLAQRIFDAELAVSLLHDELFQTICANGAIDGYLFTEWRFDDYDSSIEFDGCAPDFRLTEDQQKLLWSIGFDRCWLNHTDGWETYYQKTGSVEGSRMCRAPQTERSE